MRNWFRPVIVAAAALSLAACGINSVPTAEENAKAKWADVEAAFQERANLIPNLQEIVMSSAEQERETLNDVISARASATRPEVQIDAEDLTDPLNSLPDRQSLPSRPPAHLPGIDREIPGELRLRDVGRSERVLEGLAEGRRVLRAHARNVAQRAQPRTRKTISAL